MTTVGEPPEDIRCAQCRRHLIGLRRPCCNWCGAPVSAEDYATVVEQSQHVMALPDPVPLPPVTSYSQQSSFAGWGGNRGFWPSLLPYPVRQFRPLTPGQNRLRAVVVTIFGLLAAARIVQSLYALWLMHQMMHGLPH